jgi:hypothetical protein
LINILKELFKMNTQQAIAYENTVIESARDWFLGENSIDGVEETV